MWLIATFPSRHYDIDQYPAVRDYLLSFDKRVLAQTGEKKIDGNPNKNARKRTSNKWFETQDSISYWEDFAKPKIVWTPVNSEYRFSFIKDPMLLNNALFMVTGEALKYLCALFNSKLFIFYLSVVLTRNNYAYGSKDAFNNLVVKHISSLEQQQIETLIDNITQKNVSQQQAIIDLWVFKQYKISDVEQAYIENHVILDN